MSKQKKKSLPCIRGYLWEGAERGEVSQNQMEQNSLRYDSSAKKVFRKKKWTGEGRLNETKESLKCS